MKKGDIVMVLATGETGVITGTTGFGSVIIVDLGDPEAIYTYTTNELEKVGSA